MEKVVVRGKIVDLHISRLRKRKIYNVVITDGTGTLNLLWFTANEKYLRKTYLPGAGIIVSGEVSYNSYGKNLQIVHPKPEDVEIYSDDEDSDENTHFGRIVPIYPLTEGLTQKRIRTIVKLVVEQFADSLKGLLPEEVISPNNLSSLPEALREVQFPENSEKIIDLDSPEAIYGSRPHKTISFYEFFLLEIGLSLKKKELINQKGISFVTGGNMVNEFID